MMDPVICSDGHTYENAAIAKWLKSHSTSPKTNLVLKGKQLIPNHGLRSAIEVRRVPVLTLTPIL